MPAAADMLSPLSDSLLGLILSKIPIREAVRCSVLSNRWRFLYAQIPELTLSPFLLLGIVDSDPNPVSLATVERIISNLLMLHSQYLEGFHLFNYISKFPDIRKSKWQFTREIVWQWVRYVAMRNVQRLTLYDSHDGFPAMEIPPALFSCTCLTTLTLSNYFLTHIPSHFSGFNHLIACSFQGMEFTDHSLSCFISHSPLLQKLTIRFYVGLRNPVISSPSLTHLSIRGGVEEEEEVEVLTVNCPKLRTLELGLDTETSADPAWESKIQDLRINGMLFYELSYSIFQIKLQCGSNITGLWLELGHGKPLNFSAVRFLEIVGAFKTLKELYIIGWSLLERENQMCFLIHSLLQRLPGLARLQMGTMFYLELVRDPMLQSVTSLLPNLRRVKIRIFQFDKGEMAILGNLLQSASSLEKMEVQLPCLFQGKTNAFLRRLRLVFLERASSGARIYVKKWRWKKNSYM